MTFYSDMADVADDLIIEFGQSVTVRRQTGSTYDPDTGGSTITTSDETGHGCVIEFDKELIDGSHVRVGDRLLLLSPIGVTEPRENDLVIFGSESWQIVPPVSITAPSGVPVLYEVQLRR